MKIRKKSMSKGGALQILKEAGVLGPEIAEGYKLTRDILRAMDPEQKRSLIQLKKRLGDEEFKEVILRALSGEERQVRQPGQPNIQVIDDEENPPTFKTPSEVAREKGELPIAQPVPEFMDMPYVSEKGKKTKEPPMARPAMPYKEDTKTVRLSPKNKRNFTLTKEDEHYMSWIDKFIKEKED